MKTYGSTERRRRKEKMKKISYQRDQRKDKNNRDPYVCSGLPGQRSGKWGTEILGSESESSRPSQLCSNVADQLWCARIAGQRHPGHSKLMADGLNKSSVHAQCSNIGFAGVPVAPRELQFSPSCTARNQILLSMFLWKRVSGNSYVWWPKEACRNRKKEHTRSR